MTIQTEYNFEFIIVIESSHVYGPTYSTLHKTYFSRRLDSLEETGKDYYPGQSETENELPAECTHVLDPISHLQHVSPGNT